MKRCLRYAGIVGLGMILTACSSENWYEGTRAHSKSRDAYVEDRMETGLSELEAKKAWEMEQILIRAHGGDVERSLSGEELDQLIEP